MSATGTGTTLLQVENVETFYGSIQALKGISISVNEGEIVTLIGANGAGKSTTLRSINGLNHPRHGRITFKGKDITNEPAHKVVKLGIAQSPEGRKLFPRMTVTENLEMGAFQQPDKAAMREDMDRVFTLFPRLAERRGQKAGTLSRDLNQGEPVVPLRPVVAEQARPSLRLWRRAGRDGSNCQPDTRNRKCCARIWVCPSPLRRRSRRCGRTFGPPRSSLTCSASAVRR